jgi:hypothetical protein
MMRDLAELELQYNHSNDRVLHLELIEGQTAKNSTGLVDTRLFKGGNRFHVIKNPVNNLWSFKYEAGGLPESLKQSFTTFTKAKEFAENYFNNRGLRVTSVEDV